jgi:biopolymer transport protein ExbD
MLDAHAKREEPMRQLEASSVAAEPNITPLIDVLLVLLIIFMIAAMYHQHVIEAQLPPKQTTSTETASIVLDVLPGGSYAVNRSPIPRSELGARLRAIYTGRPEKTIFVRGDPRVSYRDVITAMDSARGAGVRVIGVPPVP